MAANKDSRKYFIPAWVMESDMPSGHKLVLSVLSTRSSEVAGGDRLSSNIGAGTIADIIQYSFLQVNKTLKDLVARGLIAPEQGGYRLLAEAPVKNEEPNYVPRYLFDGCYDWESCVSRIRAESGGLCLADIRYSYHEVAGSAPFRDEIYKILVRIEDACKEKNLPDTHKFQFGN